MKKLFKGFVVVVVLFVFVGIVFNVYVNIDVLDKIFE